MAMTVQAGLKRSESGWYPGDLNNRFTPVGQDLYFKYNIF